MLMHLYKLHVKASLSLTLLLGPKGKQKNLTNDNNKTHFLFPEKTVTDTHAVKNPKHAALVKGLAT